MSEPRFKVGDRVDYHAVIDGPVTDAGQKVWASWRVDGSFVYQLIGKRGVVSEDAITPAAPQASAAPASEPGPAPMRGAGSEAAASISPADPAAGWRGVMIDIDDPFVGHHQVPGWECETCGERIGTSGPPPMNHVCQYVLDVTGASESNDSEFQAFLRTRCEGKQYDSCVNSPCRYSSSSGCQHPEHPGNRKTGTLTPAASQAPDAPASEPGPAPMQGAGSEAEASASTTDRLDEIRRRLDGVAPVTSDYSDENYDRLVDWLNNAPADIRYLIGRVPPHDGTWIIKGGMPCAEVRTAPFSNGEREGSPGPTDAGLTAHLRSEVARLKCAVQRRNVRMGEIAAQRDAANARADAAEAGAARQSRRYSGLSADSDKLAALIGAIREAVGPASRLPACSELPEAVAALKAEAARLREMLTEARAVMDASGCCATEDCDGCPCSPSEDECELDARFQALWDGINRELAAPPSPAPHPCEGPEDGGAAPSPDGGAK